MDHQAFAQLLGNYGEFVGAIAVVVTLVYLAGQLRQNTMALRSASYEHWNQVASSFADFYAQFSDRLSEIELLSSLDQLSPEQQKLLLALMVRITEQAHTAFLQHRAGTLDDDVFDSRIAAFLGFMSSNPLLQQYWRTTPQDYPTTAFRAYIEARVPELGLNADEE